MSRMGMDLTGSRVVVTGSAGGIGRAIVDRLAKHGATVIGWDRAGDLVPGEHARLVVDVADEASVLAAAHDTSEIIGEVDVLVTAAGTLRSAPIHEMTLTDWNAIMAVNVTGTFLAVKHLSPLMSDGASVVLLASVTAYVGHVRTSAYAATKGAVISFARAISMELAPRAIRVNAVCPGWVDTGFTDHVMAEADDPVALRQSANAVHLLGRMARADEVADAVCYLASDAASFVTGSELFVDGGFMVKR